MINLLFVLVAVILGCGVTVATICGAMLIWDGKLTLPRTAERDVKQAQKKLAIKRLHIEERQLDLKMVSLDEEIDKALDHRITRQITKGDDS